MKIKNLTDCYVYHSVTERNYGETSVKWVYIGCYPLNAQQDINELDVIPAGLIDYDRVKLRSDYDYGIEKNDGISFEELEIEDGFATSPPKYKVISNLKVGNTITYTCSIYHGE